jgi:hypothetical protein
MSYPPIQKSATDDEINLRRIMRADRVVMRRRAAKGEGLTDEPGLREYSDEAREAIRAARRRQAERNRKLKSQPVVSPAKSRRAAHG